MSLNILRRLGPATKNLIGGYKSKYAKKNNKNDFVIKICCNCRISFLPGNPELSGFHVSRRLCYLCAPERL